MARTIRDRPTVAEQSRSEIDAAIESMGATVVHGEGEVRGGGEGVHSILIAMSSRYRTGFKRCGYRYYTPEGQKPMAPRLPVRLNSTTTPISGDVLLAY